MSKKLIPANKQPSYPIPLSEADFYHLQFTEATPTGRPDEFIETIRYQIFSIAGFQGYVENKSHFNYKSELILHDPTLKIQGEPEIKQPEVKEPEKGETIPEKKPLPKARAKTNYKPKKQKR
jgi:hypothetical protein